MEINSQWQHMSTAQSRQNFLADGYDRQGPEQWEARPTWETCWWTESGQNGDQLTMAVYEHHTVGVELSHRQIQQMGA